jgi:hypothetical protein
VSKKLNSQEYAVGMQELMRNSEKLMGEIPALLVAAEKTSYEDRTFSYARGGPGGVTPFRAASEKAWIVLSQVTDILVQSKLNKVPKGSYERRLALREIESKSPEIAQKHFYDRYGALTSYLRNNQNYMSTLDLEMLRFEVARLGVYVNDVKAAASK